MLVTNPTNFQTDLIPLCCTAPCQPCVFQQHVVVLMMSAATLQFFPSSSIQKVVGLAAYVCQPLSSVKYQVAPLRSTTVLRLYADSGVFQNCENEIFILLWYLYRQTSFLSMLHNVASLSLLPYSAIQEPGIDYHEHCKEPVNAYINEISKIFKIDLISFARALLSACITQESRTLCFLME